MVNESPWGRLGEKMIRCCLRLGTVAADGPDAPTLEPPMRWPAVLVLVIKRSLRPPAP